MANQEVDILVSFKDRASSGINKFSNNLKKIDTEAGKTAKGVQGLYSGLLALGGLVAGGSFLGGAVSTFASFDDNMRAAGAVTKATAEEMMAMTAVAKEMGQETSFSASQSAEALKFLGMAGFEAVDAIEALPDVLNLAAAGSMDLGTAADISTNILTSFGKEIEELANVNDVLATAFTSSNVSMVEIGESFKEVGSFANGVGGDFNDLTATIGVLGNAGIKGGKAGTSLKNALNALLNPTKAQAKAQEQLALRIGQTSLQVMDAEGNFIGFEAVMDQLEEAGMSGSEAMKAFGMIAGPEMAALVGQGAAKLEELKKKLDDADGSAKKLADQMEAGLGGELRRTASAMEAVSIAFGDAIDDELIFFLQNLQDKFGVLITKINELSKDGTFASWGVSAVNILDGIIWGADKLYTSLSAIIAVNSALILAATGDFEAAKLAMQDFVDNTNKTFETYEETASGAVVVTKEITAEMLKTRESTKAMTDETAAAKKGVEEFSAVVMGFREDGTAITILEKNMKKVSNEVIASTDNIKDFEKEAKEAYKNAKEYAKEYADKVVEYEDKIKQSKQKTDDTIRELNRAGLTELADWNDRKLEAEEKLSAAKKALLEGDYELAETLANQSATLYKGIAQEVEDNNGNVIKSLDETKDVAIKGVKAVGDFSKNMYTQQKKNAQNSQQTWKTAAAAIEKQLDEISKDKEAKVKITLQNLQTAKNEISKLTRNETKTIYVRTVQTEQDGGMIGRFRTGTYIPRKGKLPGYGGGDKVKALLESGEGILRKEAMNVIGEGQLNAWNALKFNMGGAVPNMTGNTPTNIGSNMSNGPGETLTLRFQAGEEEAAVNVTDTDSQMSLRHFAELLEKSRLTHVK